mgnify:CR=1 FL=1
MGHVLPGDEVGEGEGRAPELPVEPEAEVVQRDRGGQPRQEAGQMVGSIGPQPEGVLQLRKDPLDNPVALALFEECLVLRRPPRGRIGHCRGLEWSRAGRAGPG